METKVPKVPTKKKDSKMRQLEMKKIGVLLLLLKKLLKLHQQEKDLKGRQDEAPTLRIWSLIKAFGCCNCSTSQQTHRLP
nr:hypothetical protein CFP56_55672 [Quercus suber]